MRNLFLWALVLVASSAQVTLADSEPQLLASGQAANRPRQPQAFMSADGTVDIVYAVGDEIALQTSRDKGQTYQRSASSIRCPNMAAGMRRGPRVVRTVAGLVITAIGGRQGRGRDGDLLAWRSTDEGQTWSAASMVNSVPAAAREGLHAMAASPRGTVWCTWLDLRHDQTEVFASQSADLGKTWSTNQLVYQSPDGSVCECCHPSVVSSAESGATFMFRNALDGNRDMFLVPGADGRGTALGRKLGQGSWPLAACPMDGGMLATDGGAGLVTVWRRADRLFATRGSGDTEEPLGAGVQPWVAWSTAGPVIVWTQGREGALQLQVDLPGTPRMLAATASDPVVAADPRQEFAIVCWEATRDGTAVVEVQVIATPRL